MAENDAGTWLVMLREVSHAVRVAGQRRVMAALALDADTGLARGYSVAATGREALAEAFRAGRTRPAGPLPEFNAADSLSGPERRAVGIGLPGGYS